MSDKMIQAMLDAFTPRRVEHEGEFVVVGLGRFGSALARTLVEMGHEVLGVDVDPDLVQDHVGTLTHVVEADTTSETSLRQIGAADAVTVIVCIGSDIEASVLTTAALVDLGVRNVWAKAITEAHGRILRRVGAHHVVFPEADMGSRVAHLVTGHMLEYLPLDDDFVIAEMIAPERLVGLQLGDTNLRADDQVTVVAVKPHGGHFTYADRSTRLQRGDLIVIAGHRADVARFTQRD